MLNLEIQTFQDLFFLISGCVTEPDIPNIKIRVRFRVRVRVRVSVRVRVRVRVCKAEPDVPEFDARGRS